jgi:hypothetical protein
MGLGVCHKVDIFLVDVLELIEIHHQVGLQIIDAILGEVWDDNSVVVSILCCKAKGE